MGTIGFLTNPTNLLSKPDTSDILAAAQRVLTASTVNAIDAAFATAAEGRLAALVVDGDALFANQRDRMAALAARYRIPSTYPAYYFADAGGLMSYGDKRTEAGRQIGIYVGRILKGEKPSANDPLRKPAVQTLCIARFLIRLPDRRPPGASVEQSGRAPWRSSC